jgi:hypothetical protein
MIIGAQSDINFEVQQGASGDIAPLRGAVADCGPAVEPRGDPIAVMLGKRGHAAAIGEVQPEQAVGVLVGPAFPGVVLRASRATELKGYETSKGTIPFPLTKPPPSALLPPG